MRPLPTPVAASTPLNEVIARLANESSDGLPVVDEHGGYCGTVTSDEIEQALREDTLEATAGQLAEKRAAAHARQTLEEALGALLHARSGLPVVDDVRRPPSAG